jgi:dynein heavy chain
LQVLSDVFLPLLVQQGGLQPSGSGVLSAAATAALSSSIIVGGTTSRDILGSMQKYLSQVTQALQHLTGDVILDVPQLVIESVEVGAKDPDVVHLLEEAIAGWSAKLSEVMQRESEKKPGGKGPLAEIDFWRSRSAVSEDIISTDFQRCAGLISRVIAGAVLPEVCSTK